MILASSISLALFGVIWLLFAVPMLRGAVAGLRTGNWWQPFERRARGGYGVLAGSRSFALFRGPETDGRTRAGLLTRWGIWLFVVAGLGYYPLMLVLDLVEIARRS